MENGGKCDESRSTARPGARCRPPPGTGRPGRPRPVACLANGDRGWPKTRRSPARAPRLFAPGRAFRDRLCGRRRRSPADPRDVMRLQRLAPALLTLAPLAAVQMVALAAPRLPGFAADF